MENKKPIYVKPSLYAHYYLYLKEIAKKYGYNLVLHGSMNRDLDLIAIPWEEVIGNHTEMVQEFSELLGGEIQKHDLRLDENDNIIGDIHDITFHGRMRYIININREGETVNGEWIDKQYYLDISVMPGK